MLPLWTPHRHSSFAAFILLLGLSVGAPSEAALTKPDVEIDPILPSIPLPVAIPSLSGSRFHQVSNYAGVLIALSLPLISKNPSIISLGQQSIRD